MLTLDKVYHAKHVLKEVLRPTQVISAPKINPKGNVFLKTENLQITGSFKVRGAYYKISQLTEEEKSHGVIACSAGNHAQGVALAAQKNGIKAVICLPDGAPISKVEATRSYGAEICLVEGVYDDAYNKAIQLKEENNYTFIHPFDDENVIAGQGTIGLELIEQVPDLDAVVVPVGGGGLISGVAFALKSLNPNIKVYGVQASGAPSMVESLAENKIKCLDSVSTIADGIKVKEPGEHTFEYCKKYVDDIVTVTDDEVSSAILALIENIQRADLNFFEEAEAIALLIQEFNITQEETAMRLGMAQPTIANKLRLLKIPPHERAMIFNNKLTERHARALLKINDETKRREVLNYIIENNLTVDATEKYIKSFEEKEKIEESYKKRSPILKDIKLFFNTVDKAVKVMQLAGVDAEVKKQKHDGLIEYTILITDNKE